MPAEGLLVYDADCGFCTRFARWTGRGVPWQEVDLASVGATSEELQMAAGWMEEGRITRWGAEAIASALVARGPATAAVGHVIQWPAVRRLAAFVYRLVASNRHVFPGGASTCSGRSRGLGLRIGCFAGIGLIWLLGVTADQTWGQSYPVLDQPAFRRVLGGDSGSFTARRIDIDLLRSNGRRTVADEHSLLPGPPSSTHRVAHWLLSARPSEARQFVRRLIAHVGGPPVDALHIRLRKFTYDLESGELRSKRLVKERTIPVPGHGA